MEIHQITNRDGLVLFQGDDDNACRDFSIDVVTTLQHVERGEEDEEKATEGPRREYYIHGPVMFNTRTSKLVQLIVKRQQGYIATLDDLLSKKPRNLEGIKTMIKNLMNFLLRGFVYIVVGVPYVVVLGIVYVGEAVVNSVRSFEIRFPDGESFRVNSSWLYQETEIHAEGSPSIYTGREWFPETPIGVPDLGEDTFVFDGRYLYKLPEDDAINLRVVCDAVRNKLAEGEGEADALRATIRRSVFETPFWLRTVDLSSFRSVSGKMILYGIAAPLTFILTSVGGLGVAAVRSVGMLLQPLFVLLEMFIKTYDETYPLDQFSRFYSQKINEAWDEYKEAIGAIPQSVYDSVKSMVDAAS